MNGRLGGGRERLGEPGLSPKVLWDIGCWHLCSSITYSLGSQQADLGSLSPKAKIPSGSHNGDVEGELVGGSRGLRLSTTYTD